MVGAHDGALTNRNGERAAQLTREQIASDTQGRIGLAQQIEKIQQGTC